MTPNWASEALEKLQNGLPAEIRPRGHSMTGRISDGDLVTLEPVGTRQLAPSDIVLACIFGKHYSHVVLHMILAVADDRFLIGGHQGRVDGWVSRTEIYGIATKVEAL